MWGSVRPLKYTLSSAHGHDDSKYVYNMGVDPQGAEPIEEQRYKQTHEEIYIYSRYI